MEIKIDTTLERDMDLLIMEEFIADREFASMLLQVAHIDLNYELVKVIHSKTDADLGESDMVFVLQVNGRKHALHIEDKIDAIAMKRQNERYHLRAEKDIENGEYDSYSVMIVAPQKYLEKNSEAKKYEYQVTYEQVLEYFAKKDDMRSKYKIALVKRAIFEQGSGYQWKESPDVARFCRAMYKYQDEYFPRMTKGTVAWWPIYKTIHKGIEVWFKANKGYCDLAFTKTNYHDLYLEYHDKIYGKMQIVETGKSAAIRIEVKPIRFEDEFDDVIEDVHEALEAMKILLEFGNSLIL